ncbi:MAG: DUF998 domain-containing protein [Kineosporiaceae bacterium]
MTARRWGAWLGVGAQVVFVTAFLVAALWQGPRYDPVAHTISDMYAVTAPHGAALAWVLALCGLATVVFALGALAPALSGTGARGRVGAVLVAVSILGLGDLLSPLEREACRLADPGCTESDQLANLGGVLDGVLSSLGLAALIAAAFVLAGPVARLSGPAAGKAVRATGAALIVLVLATVLIPGAGGLMERLLAGAAAAFVAGLGVVVLRAEDVRPS